MQSNRLKMENPFMKEVFSGFNHPNYKLFTSCIEWMNNKIKNEDTIFLSEDKDYISEDQACAVIVTNFVAANKDDEYHRRIALKTLCDTALLHCKQNGITPKPSYYYEEPKYLWGEKETKETKIVPSSKEDQ